MVRLVIYAVTWWGTAQVIALATAYQRDVRRRLRTDARTDVLTSLANRRDLEERLTRAVPGDCVVIADLDHFKRVNDTRGHAAGDAVLERFGHALHEHLRRRDYAARYGGEEFVLILPRTEPVQALNMLRALRAEWAEEGTGVTFSAGIALLTDGAPAGSALAARGHRAVPGEAGGAGPVPDRDRGPRGRAAPRGGPAGAGPAGAGGAGPLERPARRAAGPARGLLRPATRPACAAAVRPWRSPRSVLRLEIGGRKHRCRAEAPISAHRVRRAPEGRRRPGPSGPGLRLLTGRGGGIRTHDLLVPNEARYQAAPHPGEARPA